MTTCPDCGHAVSTTAAACPNCGHVMNAAAATPHAAHTGAGHTHAHTRKRVGAGRWLAGLFFLTLLILVALWYFDVVNFV